MRIVTLSNGHTVTIGQGFTPGHWPGWSYEQFSKVIELGTMPTHLQYDQVTREAMVLVDTYLCAPADILYFLRCFSPDITDELLQQVLQQVLTDEDFLQIWRAIREENPSFFPAIVGQSMLTSAN